MASDAEMFQFDDVIVKTLGRNVEMTLRSVWITMNFQNDILVNSVKIQNSFMETNYTLTFNFMLIKLLISARRKLRPTTDALFISSSIFYLAWTWRSKNDICKTGLPRGITVMSYKNKNSVPMELSC